MDAGDYLIRVGDSSRTPTSRPRSGLRHTLVTEKVHNELTDQAPPTELDQQPRRLLLVRR